MNEIPTIGSSAIPKVGIDGPSIIPTIDPPLIKSLEVPLIRGLALPVVNIPNPRIKYPVIEVPTQEEFDAAVKADKARLDFELVRLLKCGEAMKSGVMFHPESPYSKICADVVVRK